MVAFSHDQAGTADAGWLGSPRMLAMAGLDVSWTGLEKLVVVAAHPDDESLGAAGLLQRAARYGVPIEIVLATLGENSHPHSPTHTPERLAAKRAIEFGNALAVLAGSARHKSLRLPDGQVAARTGELEEAIAAAVRPGGAATLVVAPWSGDGHTDHEAAGVAAAKVARATGALFLEYPIWLWHWGSPSHGSVPWPALRKLDLGRAERCAKSAAISSHASQVNPLSTAAGDEVLLTEAFLTHFNRDFETFIDTAGSFIPSGAALTPWLQSQFDAVHAEGGEPWEPASWYERRKRSLVLGALPRERYASVLELGCSTGALTADLALRATRITAVDASAEAVATAQHRMAGRGNATIVQATLPDQWPSGGFDLFILSETGYYFPEADIGELVARMAASALPGACLAACHWRHPISGWPLGGEDVHRLLRQDVRLTSAGAYAEEDFLLEIFLLGDPP